MILQTTRSFLYPVFGLFLVLALAMGCEQTCYDGEQNQDEEAVDCGGPCIPCDSIILPPDPPTCFDGILNQDETGIDCGGICPPCPNDTITPPPADQLCTGDGSSALLPLTIGNYWQYTVSSGQWFNLTITESVALLGNNYFKMETGGQFGPIVDYFRTDGAGVVYHLQSDVSGTPTGTEYVFADPGAIPGTGWPVVANAVDSVALISDGGTLVSQNGCTYTNVSVFEQYQAGVMTSNRQMQPGLGTVAFVFNGGVTTAYLDSVALQ
jgi:hypothetical protein